MGNQLIQAIELRNEDKPYIAGLGQYFRFRNHGAAEYEFGAIPEAIRRMRLSYESLKDFELNIHGHRAIVICHPDDETEVNTFFKDELRGNRSHGRAYLCMRDAYGIGEREPLHAEVAWVNLSAEVPWVVCKTDDIAAKWRAGLQDLSKPVYAYSSGGSLKLFYSKEDFESEISREISYERDGHFLERVELKDVWKSHELYIGYNTQLIVQLHDRSYAEVLVEAAKAKSKNPDAVFLWREIKMDVNTTYTYEIAPVEQKNRW